MAKKYIFIGACVILTIVIIFGIAAELNKSKQLLLSEVKQKQEIVSLIPMWMRTNKDIIKIQSQMDDVVDFQAKYNCTVGAVHQSFDCEGYAQRMDSLRQQLFAEIEDLKIKK